MSADHRSFLELVEKLHALGASHIRVGSDEVHFGTFSGGVNLTQEENPYLSIVEDPAAERKKSEEVAPWRGYSKEELGRA